MGIDSKLVSVPKFDQLEVIKVGVTTISSDGSPSNWTTITHGLGFKPIVLAFLNDVNANLITGETDIPLPTFLNATIYGGEFHFIDWVQAYASTTQINFFYFNGSLNVVSPVSIKYYLLRQRSG